MWVTVQDPQHSNGQRESGTRVVVSCGHQKRLRWIEISLYYSKYSCVLHVLFCGNLVADLRLNRPHAHKAPQFPHYRGDGNLSRGRRQAEQRFRGHREENRKGFDELAYIEKEVCVVYFVSFLSFDTV